MCSQISLPDDDVLICSFYSVLSYHSDVKDFIIKTNITLFVVFTLLTVYGPESQTGSLDGLLGPVECGRVCSVLSYGGRIIWTELYSIQYISLLKYTTLTVLVL